MPDSSTAVECKPLVGPMDVVLLASFIGALLYWFCGRKKKAEPAFPPNLMAVKPSSKVTQEDTSFIGKMKKTGKSIAIFYGSQTGTAEEFATRVAKDAQRYGLKTAVFDQEEIDIVFALGNKTYEYFNAMGRLVDKKLEEMGAKRVFERGEGDDDGKRLSSCIKRQFKLEIHEDISEDKIFTGEVSRLKSYQQQRPPFDAKNPYLPPIQVNRELHKGGNRSCMHIELDISGASIKYDAGDHVGIYPINDHELVDIMGKILNVDVDTVISLVNVDEDASKKNPFPCPTTYRTALLHYVDMSSHVLRELAEYATDPKEKDFLTNISDSTKDAKIRWRPVIWGLAVQFIFSLLILRNRQGFAAFNFLGRTVQSLLNFTDVGAKFVFGNKFMEHSFFALKVFPVIVFSSSFISLCYYIGILQVVIKVARLMQVTMGTSAIESFNAAGNIFVGQTEAPLLVRLFLSHVMKSELHAIMTGGSATIAGSVLAAYIELGVSASHLPCSASVTSAPAALAIKLLYPERDKPGTLDEDIDLPSSGERNVIKAAAWGASTAIALVANIAANLIAFLALLAFFNAILSWLGSIVGYPEVSFEIVLGKVKKSSLCVHSVFPITLRKKSLNKWPSQACL